MENEIGRKFFFALETERVILPATWNLQVQFKACGSVCTTSPYCPSWCLQKVMQSSCHGRQEEVPQAAIEIKVQWGVMKTNIIPFCSEFFCEFFMVCLLFSGFMSSPQRFIIHFFSSVGGSISTLFWMLLFSHMLFSCAWSLSSVQILQIYQNNLFV